MRIRGNRRVGCLTAGLLAVMLWTMAPTIARAGCGCDHPPTGWSQVMPAFASPGRSITVYAENGEFVRGAVYRVDLDRTFVDVVAGHTDFVTFEMPAGVSPGPVAIDVSGPGYSHVYPRELFTALPDAVVMPADTGALVEKRWKTAIAADGTLLIPIDMSQVLEPTQFAFVARNLPLDFEHDDVVIYNGDGVDLSLFTLQVENATLRQWGSYYGWAVEEDTNLIDFVFDKKVKKSKKKDRESDVFTYWRHEFYTYAEAHAIGGSHEIDSHGLHPDATVHVDHDSLVLAIWGVERDTRNPDDLTRAKPLEPGNRSLDFVAVMIQAVNPVEPEDVVVEIEAAAPEATVTPTP